MELKIKDNEFLRQFECDIAGEKAVIEYSQQERKIFLTKLVMSEALKEQGYKEPFMEGVLKILNERGIKVMPTSPAIAGFMRKNRTKYKDYLPVGISI